MKESTKPQIMGCSPFEQIAFKQVDCRWSTTALADTIFSITALASNSHGTAECVTVGTWLMWV